jgi:hypothetical protein
MLPGSATPRLAQTVVTGTLPSTILEKAAEARLERGDYLIYRSIRPGLLHIMHRTWPMPASMFTVRRVAGFSMWSTMVFVAVIAQAQPSPSAKWCFERGQQGAQLCENTESECFKLRSINTEIATSPCKRIELPEIQRSPSGPPAPEQQAPTQRP